MSGLSNLDPHNLKSLNKLQQFEAFFDMIQNPAKYAEIVSDAKKTLAAMHEMLGPYNTVKLAEEYLAKSKQYAAETVASAENQKQQINEEINSSLKELEQVKAKINAAELEVANKAAANDQLKTQLENSLETLRKDQEAIHIKRQELNEKEKSLFLKEKALDSKATKLKEIIG